MLKIKLDMKLKVSLLSRRSILCNIMESVFHFVMMYCFQTSRILFAKIKLEAFNLFLKRSNAGEQSISFKFSFYVGNQAKGSFVKYEQVAA